MSVLGRVFGGRKTKFVLKGRKEGKWEELGEFDTKVGVLDVRDIIENALDDGYDAFRLEEVTEDGKRVKLVWTKYYKTAAKRKTEDAVADTVTQTLKQVIPTAVNTALNTSMTIVDTALSSVNRVVSSSISQLIDTLISKMRELQTPQQERPSLAELLAEYLYTQDLLRKVAKVVTQQQGGASSSTEDPGLRFLAMLIALQRPDLAPLISSWLGVPVPTTTQTPIAQTQQQYTSPQIASMQIPSPPDQTLQETEVTEARKRAEELAKRLIEETQHEVAKEIAPCQSLDACTEFEG